MSNGSSTSGAPWPLTILVALLGGAALFTPGGGNQSRPTPTSRPAEADEKSTKSEAPFTRQQLAMSRQARLDGPLCGYLGMPLTACVPAELLKSESKVEFLVCTLPDPIDTEVGFNFDPMLDSLQYALSRDQFVLDRYYLPWQEHERRQKEKKESKLMPEPRVYEEEPGVLLFRKGDAGRAELLIVYIIGETPTAGIHKQAFAEAINQIKRLKCSATCSELRILGPALTGSAASLALAISKFAHKPDFTGVNVMSGSASGVDRAIFESACSCSSADSQEFCVEFGTTTVHNNVQTAAMLKFVAEQHLAPKRRKVAWLVEANTSFGQMVTRPKDASKADSGTETTDLYWKKVVFRFPLHISRVRSAYAEAHRSDNSAIPQARRRYELQIPLEELQSGRDLPPRFTPSVTVASVELLLGQIMDTIRRDGIRYVGITASDTRDRIFLANIIRKQFPGVQILLVSGDLLYVHSDSIESLVGAIVASPYPLFAENEHWSFPYAGGTEHVVLSNSLAKGLYNAVGLLRHPKWRCGVVETENMWLTDYGPPFALANGTAPLTPQAWISIIGSDGIWPVAAVPPTGAHKEYAYAAKPLVSGNDGGGPTAAGNFYLSGRAFALWVALLGLATYTIVETFTRHKEDRVQPFHLPQRRLPLIACTIPLATLVLWIATRLIFSLHPAKTLHGGEITGINLVICVSSVLAAATLLGICLRYIATTPAGGAKRIRFDRHLVLSSVIAAVIVAMPIYMGWQDAPADAALAFVRTFTLSSSISIFPTLAFLVAAFYAWGYTWLKLNAWNRELIVKRPWSYASIRQAEHLNNILLRLLRESARKLKRAVTKPWHWFHPSDASRVVIAVAATLLWLAYLWWHSVPTVEGPILTVAIQAAIAVLLMLGVLGLWRMETFRKRLTKLLQAMSQFELKESYLRIRSEDESGLDRFLSSHRPRQSDVKDSLQYRLHRLDLAAKAYGKQSGTIKLPVVRPQATEPNDLCSDIQRIWDQIFTRSHELTDNKQTWDQRLLLSKWEDCAQDVIAVHSKLYLRSYIGQLRNLRNGLGAMGSLLLLAVFSYPVQPQGLLVLSSTLLVAAVMATAIWIYVCLDRDKVLSQIVGTTENKLGWDWSFAMKVLPWAVVGTVLIMSQLFPDTWAWMRTYLAPISQVKT